MTDRKQKKAWFKVLIAASLSVIVVFVLMFFFGERFEEKTFAASSPIVEAHATAYANFFGLFGWDQDHFIKLYKNADPSAVVDLRLFGSLQPDPNPETHVSEKPRR
jgi:hypothetical protein